jgi:hypothetical protein
VVRVSPGLRELWELWESPKIKFIVILKNYASICVAYSSHMLA